MTNNWNEKAYPDRSFSDGSTYKAYRVQKEYDAKMLVRDLLAAGVKIFELEYEDDPDDGARRISGEGTAEHFLRKMYDDMLGQGNVGVSYTFFCQKGDEAFEVSTADTGVITLNTMNSALEMADVLQ